MMIWLLAVVLIIVLAYCGIQTYVRKMVVEKRDTSSAATHPGGLKPKRLFVLDMAPDLYGFNTKWEDIKDAFRGRVFVARQLWLGASNPAVVVHENPTIIAAYAADCDAVVLVRFLPEIIKAAGERGIGLRPGTRMLTVNTYFPREFEFKNLDIEYGPRQSGLWVNFRPFIAEFYSADIDAIEARKREISEDLWERTKQLGLAKLKDANLDEVRWGHPMYAYVPRSYRNAIEHAEYWEVPH